MKRVNWNIDPIRAEYIDTDEVQIWADVSRKDAAYIVQAVNAHEALVKVLKNIMQEEDAKDDFTPDWWGQAKAALKLASDASAGRLNRD